MTIRANEHDLDLSAVRARLKHTQGKEYWRSLEELAGTVEFQAFLEREFPSRASEWRDPLSRRRFLKLMGASLALAGISGCTRQPVETIVPYTRQPEEMVPGQPLFFATAMSISGIATGLLIESHEGRPTKVEGNPDHPGSLGATDAWAQASILGLYDPDRSQTVTYLGDIRSWSAFLGALDVALETHRQRKGAGLRILTETVTSPTLAYQLRAILQELPQAKWHQYEPLGRDHVLEGSRLAFGTYVNTLYRFDKADVILSIDSDFLMSGPGHLRYVHDFSSKRKIQGTNTRTNRLYVVESTFTNTGAVADHRLRLRPSQIEEFTRVLMSRLNTTKRNQARDVSALDRSDNWLSALARDLEQHRGTSIVIPGDEQSPVVHAFTHRLNSTLGNIDKTIVYTDPIEAEPDNQMASLRELVQDIDAGSVDTLIILGGNPVYTAPADLNFGERLVKVGLGIHLSLYFDETSERCHWHIPEAHFLESWSDTRAYDGTVTIVQPLIAPLYNGKTSHEVLSALTAQPERSSYDIVRSYWRNTALKEDGPRVGRPRSAYTKATASKKLSAEEFELFWRKALHDGIMPGTAFPRKSVTLKPVSNLENLISATGGSKPEFGNTLEILFRADPTIFDGRFANNAWLQELPKPLTRLTWDNAALISPTTAERLGLGYKISTTGGERGHVLADQVQLQYQGRKILAPIWILPGQADDCISVHLGYGRSRTGNVGVGAGFNANAIRTSNAPWFGLGLVIHKAGGRHPLACVDFHHNMAGRDLVRSATVNEYLERPDFARVGPEPPKNFSIYAPYQYQGYAWGMAIDLNACIGCNACVIACQAENNVPIVGKTEVMRGREMHWLRIDRYYRGQLDNPEAFFQPVPCMHCENAPCEVVCPVAATVHSAEGLNDMVYNRCVGTRYCSNNCPYKVRRFNFLQYEDWSASSLSLMRNPNVSVRSRGVMEKCTYCVQRINRAKIQAEREDRLVKDGEIVTACQAACPAGAITFGDINDPNSRVSKLKSEPRNYGLLSELNTQPRTTYLAALRNPNPEMQKEKR